MKIANWLQLHPLFKVVLALIMGILWGNAVAELLPKSVWLGVTSLLLCICLACWKHKILQSILQLITIMLLGAYLLIAHKQQTKVSIPPYSEVIQGVVINVPQQRGKVLQCDVWITTGTLKDKKVKIAFLRDTIGQCDEEIRLGKAIQLHAYWQAIESETSENKHFNYLKWLAIQGYVAQAFVPYHHWHLVSFHDKSLPRLQRLRLFSQKIRVQLAEKFKFLGLENQSYAVVTAMTLGDKSLLSKETKENYSVTGASHVLALSGLHLSIVFGLLTLIGGRKTSQWHWFSMPITLVLVWCYVFITGMSASVMRAAIMLSVYSFVSLLYREKASINVLSLTAIVMLVGYPPVLWDISFQLSFMAVFGILLLYQFINSLIPRKWLFNNVILQNIWSTMAVSIAAQIGTAPLVAYYFGRFSTYFLLTNMIAIPLTIVILYGSVLLFALSFVPLWQQWVAYGLAEISDWLNQSLAMIASWRGASIENININEWQVVLIYIMIAVFFLIVYYLQKGRRQAKIY